jgi:hypothetical protein
MSVELEQTGSPDVPAARDCLSNSVNMRRNMKTISFIIGLSVGLMGQALAQTDQQGSPSEVTNKISSDALVTKSGMVYRKFHVERADPAGLTISYVTDGGGLGMEKVPFNLLPDDWQRRYGYDPEKAAKFDLEQKKAMTQLREQMIVDEKASREKRAQKEEAEEPGAAQAKIDAEAAQKASEATTTQATNSLAMINSPEMTNLMAITNPSEMSNLLAIINSPGMTNSLAMTNSPEMTNLLGTMNSWGMTNLPAMTDTNQPAETTPPGGY